MKRNKKVLIVVDAQYDFMPGGSLAVPEGDKIIPVINNLLPNFDLVIFTKDWHDKDMKAFASNHKDKKPFDKYIVKGKEDTLWPSHCVQGTHGADIHEDIDMGLIKGDFYIFKKGMDKKDHPYSGFGAKGLTEFLEEREVEDVYIVGLATDYCVKDTAVDSAKLGFKTIIIKDACKPINKDLDNVYEELYNANVNIIENWEMSLYNLIKE